MNSAVLYTSTYVELPESENIIAGILEQISNTLRKTSGSRNVKEAATDVLPPEEILGDPDFNPALLEKLKQDQKLQRLEGMLKGSRNFVFSQEKRNATPYSPPERMELFLKNLRLSLPSLYAQKSTPKGPAIREAKGVESLAAIRFIDDPAPLEEADFLDQLCLRGALCDLILGQTELLDPVNGDAACQLRAPFIVSARLETLHFLRANKSEAGAVQDWVRDFCAANGLHKNAGPISPVQILRLRWQPEHPQLRDIFTRLLAHIQNALSKSGAIDTTGFLALAKALTLTQGAEVDRFGLPVARHNFTLYRDSRELDKRKVALASLTRDYMLALAQTLTKTPALEGKALPAMLLTCLEESAAYMPLGKGQKLPCLPMYPGLRTVLLGEEAQGRPLVVYLKRLGFQRANPAFAAFDQEARYSLNGAEVFCFLPKAGGGFELADPNAADFATRPALCIDAWSMVDLDGAPPATATSDAERNLYDPDFQTYRAAFLKADTLGMIMAAACAHAPLPTIARAPEHPEGWADCGRAYALDLMRRAAPAPDSGAALRGIMDDIFHGGKLAPHDLRGEYEQFLDYLGSRDQFELIYSQPESVKNLQAKPSAHRRIKRNVPFTPVHIHASTFAAKAAECQALKESLDKNRVAFADTRTSEVIH